MEDFARGVEPDAPCPDDPSTSRLVGFANALRSMPLRRSPELTLAVRRRIVNAARASQPEEPRSLLAGVLDGFRVQRGLAATTALLTAAVALISIGFGTTKALPGDTLYGLKLRGESISIALARSDEAKGYSYLRFAGARLRDVSGLIDHDGSWREAAVTTEDRQPNRHLAGLVNSTLNTMNGYTDRGAQSLRHAYQRTGDPAPLAYLDDFTKTQHQALSGMLGRLPAASQSVAGASLNLVDRLAKEASKLLTEKCGHGASCQSQGRPSDQAASSEAPVATPTAAPPSSLTSDIPTTRSPDPGRPPASQGTSPQRTPSTSQQPPGTTTPGDGTSNGDQPSSTPSSTPSTPPSTDSSNGDGNSGGDSSTSSDSTDSTPSEPSPPQPTGVPSTSSDRSTDASSPSAGSGSGSGTTAPDTSSNTGSSDNTGSNSSAGSSSSTGTDPAGSNSQDSSTAANNTDATGSTSDANGSGDAGGSGSGSGDAGTPATKPSEPTDPAPTTTSEASRGADSSGAPPDNKSSDHSWTGHHTYSPRHGKTHAPDPLTAIP